MDYYLLNAFSDKPDQGNPAAVVCLDHALSEGTFQELAREIDQRATAFIWPLRNTDTYRVAWYSPKCEIQLCGHGALAAGKVIFEFLRPELDKVKLQSCLHGLVVTKSIDLLSLELPIRKFEEIVTPVLINKVLNCSVNKAFFGNGTHLVLLEDSDALDVLAPNFNLMKANQMFLAAFAPGTQTDVVCRFFGPSTGYNEDYVTGSVHTVLAPIWKNLTGQSRYRVEQRSSRPGKMEVELIEKVVRITGKARATGTGTISSPFC